MDTYTHVRVLPIPTCDFTTLPTGTPETGLLIAVFPRILLVSPGTLAGVSGDPACYRFPLSGSIVGSVFTDCTTTAGGVVKLILND